MKTAPREEMMKMERVGERIAERISEVAGGSMSLNDCEKCRIPSGAETVEICILSD